MHVKFLPLLLLTFLILNCAGAGTQPSRHGDTLIILGFPARPDGTPTPLMKYRLDRALELYGRRDVGTIIVTGGAVQNQYAEADVMKKYLVEHGVPEDIIITEKQAGSTFGNAYYSSRLLKELNLKNPIIVTSEEHEARAKWTFKLYVNNFRMAGELADH